MLEAKTKEQEDYIKSLVEKKVAMVLLPFLTILSIIVLTAVSMLTFLLTQWQR